MAKLIFHKNRPAFFLLACFCFKIHALHIQKKYYICSLFLVCPFFTIWNNI